MFGWLTAWWHILEWTWWHIRVSRVLRCRRRPDWDAVSGCYVVQGFRVSAEQQISAAYLATGSDDLERIDLEMLHEAAVTLFNQYLSDKVSQSVS